MKIIQHEDMKGAVGREATLLQRLRDFFQDCTSLVEFGCGDFRPGGGGRFRPGAGARRVEAQIDIH